MLDIVTLMYSFNVNLGVLVKLADFGVARELSAKPNLDGSSSDVVVYGHSHSLGNSSTYTNGVVFANSHEREAGNVSGHPLTEYLGSRWYVGT